MCRLYGLRSTHATRVGCELIESQNSLIRQSVQDARGFANPHGWGVGFVMEDGTVSCRREVEPASESEDFRDHATEIEAPTVIAHVRRATVGSQMRANTHPFIDHGAMLAHNGHIDFFEEVQPKILEQLTLARREAILGTTDSEHIFHLLRHRRDQNPDWSMADTLKHVIEELRTWAEEVDPEARVAVNVIWVEGHKMAGSRYNRSLFYIERDTPHVCEICGQQHAFPEDGEEYHVVEIASERLSSEDWQEMPRDSVFQVGPKEHLLIEPLFDG